MYCFLSTPFSIFLFFAAKKRCLTCKTPLFYSLSFSYHEFYALVGAVVIALRFEFVNLVAQTANGFIDDEGNALQISNEHTQMLSHKLRAEEDAILVGHTTDIREHPQLTVRHWHGPNPKRIVLTRHRPLLQLMDDLYQHGIQSLIVEGGCQTHESFIEAGLWDEIRVETAPITVTGGTPAPKLPVGVKVHSQQVFDQNIIVTYTKQ